jgi:hypothetical protein
MAQKDRSLYESILNESYEAEDSLCEMLISLRIADFQIDLQGEAQLVPDTDEVLIEVGGTWDHDRMQWSNQDPEKYQVIRVPRGSDQEAPARELAKWLGLYAQGKNGPHWKRAMARRYYQMLLLGGRRAGKSHIAVVALAMFCFLKPGSLCWAVSPTVDETDELISALKTIVPRSCAKLKPVGTTKAFSLHFANGSRLLMLSGHKPDGLKRGKTDLVLYNEAQKMSQKGLMQLRGAIGDSGGLIIITANPPDKEIGLYVEKLWDDAQAGKIACIAFKITAENNPFIVIESLHEMKSEMSDLEYRREIGGELGPIGDATFHEFRSANVRSVPAGFIDITASFTATRLPRKCAYVAGMDFQKDPHMVAVIVKFFRDPNDADKLDYMWIVDEFLVDDSDEEQLVAAIENCEAWKADRSESSELGKDFYTGDTTDPNHVGVVADASGWFQDGAHQKGRRSDKRLIAAGWRNLSKPQRDSDRNPEISERVKITNALLCNGLQQRRLFVEPHCVHTIKGLRTCPRKNGTMDRGSRYSHVCDGVSYVAYRFFGKPRKKSEISSEYISVKIERKRFI